MSSSPWLGVGLRFCIFSKLPDDAGSWTRLEIHFDLHQETFRTADLGAGVHPREVIVGAVRVEQTPAPTH